MCGQTPRLRILGLQKGMPIKPQVHVNLLQEILPSLCKPINDQLQDSNKLTQERLNCSRSGAISPKSKLKYNYLPS